MYYDDKWYYPPKTYFGIEADSILFWCAVGIIVLGTILTVRWLRGWK